MFYFVSLSVCWSLIRFPHGDIVVEMGEPVSVKELGWGVKRGRRLFECI